MDTFNLYDCLVRLESMAKHYPRSDAQQARIQDVEKLVRSRRYRVAVIGEFKRGKSSLLNALLGAQVLPTDVLPTTAVVMRIVYGKEKRLRILYHDGHEEMHDLDSLVRYGTKLDEQSEAMAQTIREMEVTYPTMLGREAIELIDTPGLNDNEQMSAVTLNVLGEIDAALVVLSARHPLSETERNLIAQLIAQQDIRQILFVVSFIDALRPKELTRMLDFLEKRLKEDTLECVLERYPEMEAKGRGILEKPVMYPVSSVQAMDAFIRNDDELLEQSRFDVFKRNLVTHLLAGQQVSVECRAAECVREAAAQIALWQDEQNKSCEERLKQLEGLETVFSAFVSAGMEPAQRALIHGDEKMRIDMDVQATWMRERFIASLSQVRRDSNLQEAIAKALESGARQCIEKVVQPALDRCGVSIERGVEQTYRELAEHLYREVYEWKDVRETIDRAALIRPPVPAFQWHKSVVPRGNLQDMELMPWLDEWIDDALRSWKIQMEDALTAWRRDVFGLWREILSKIEAGLKEVRRETLLTHDAWDKAVTRHKEDQKMLANIREMMEEGNS